MSASDHTNDAEQAEESEVLCFNDTETMIEALTIACEELQRYKNHVVTPNEYDYVVAECLECLEQVKAAKEYMEADDPGEDPVADAVESDKVFDLFNMMWERQKSQ